MHNCTKLAYIPSIDMNFFNFEVMAVVSCWQNIGQEQCSLVTHCRNVMLPEAVLVDSGARTV